MIGDVAASPSSCPSTWMPAFASANSGTITKLVQGWSRYWSRSFAEIADATLSCAERASSGVGCSRKERVSSVTRSRSVRAGGYALVTRPTASPVMTGSMPDSKSATHMATPRSAAAGPRQAIGAYRSASSTPKRPTAMASGTNETSSVYTVAITSSATRSSMTASVSRRTRRRVPPGATSASTPSAKAVSVDIAAPQPFAPAPPALNARKIRTGSAMPPSAATSGIAMRRRSRSCPMSSSRLASSPTTRKKNVIRPSFTQCRRSCGDAVVPEADREVRRPERLVGVRPGRVRPEERGDGRAAAGPRRRRSPC